MPIVQLAYLWQPFVLSSVSLDNMVPTVMYEASNISSLRAVIFVLFTECSQHLEQSMAHSRWSISVCCINGMLSELSVTHIGSCQVNRSHMVGRGLFCYNNSKHAWISGSWFLYVVTANCASFGFGGF